MFWTPAGYTQPAPDATPFDSRSAPVKSSKIWQSAWFSGLGAWPETIEM